MPGPYCCQLSSENVDVHAGSGTLASSVTVSTGCGDLTCPWVLKAVAGQQINISIIDFRYGKFYCVVFYSCYIKVWYTKLWSNQYKHPDTFPTISAVEGVNDGAIYAAACAAYVIIKEETVSTTTTLCAGQSQGSHVYLSTSNMVEISFVQTNMDDEKYFLIEYEGKLINWSTILQSFSILNNTHIDWFILL